MKCFYIVVSPSSVCGGDWGKSTSLKSAISEARVKKFSDSFIIYQAIIKDTATPEQVSNLRDCFNVNDLGGVEVYSNPSQEDLNMINEYLLGWITNNEFVKI